MPTVPLSGTNIRVLSGIPFNNDYKHTRWFTSRNQQTTWFSSQNRVLELSEYNFQRIEGKHFIKANKSIDELWGANYLMFQNADYNNKWFYAFVTQLEYRQRNTTLIHFEIDVLQTWCFDMNFKPSFVVREHQRLWNNDGTPVINTIDEGLNYGTDYDTIRTMQIQPNGAYKWLVIVSKTSLGDNEIESSIVGTPQPLVYYAIPYRDNGDTPNVVLSDSGIPANGMGSPGQVLEALYRSVQTVNDIVSVYVTDSIGVEYEYDDNTITFTGSGDSITRTQIQYDGESFSLLRFRHVERFVPDFHTVWSDKYAGVRDNVKESKLLMYPYTVLVMTDFKGNHAEFKLEFIQDQHNRVRVAFKGSLGVSNFVTVNIDSYNRLLGDGQAVETSNESAMINSDPSDVSIMNDMLAAFLQGNRNSLENTKAQTAWNGTMNALGSGVAGLASGMMGNAPGVASAGVSVVQGLGNTVYELQGIEAKQQDINNIPPEMAKMGSNTAYNYGHGYNGVFLMLKQIKPEYIRKLEDFFNMFGYKQNEVKIPNFRTRRYWNYVQTKSCTITGNFNNEDLQELKNVFDNGITLWHTDDIGNYDLSNEVR